jgi:hypothetical protein
VNLESQLRAAALAALAYGDWRALADRAGWHYHTLCQWLTDPPRRVKDVAKLESLAAALGVRLAVVDADTDAL